MGAPQWEDRRVPCGGGLTEWRQPLGKPWTRHDDRRDGRRDGRRTGDGRADGVVVRERRSGVGRIGGLRALTVGTAGVEDVGRCEKICNFGDFRRTSPDVIGRKIRLRSFTVIFFRYHNKG